jgi:hypothetical protein
MVRVSVLALVLALAGCATSGGPDDANGAVYDAWANGRSQIEVTATGSVARILSTRRGPSGVHEDFLLHLRGSAGRGLTVRVEDNVDLTGSIPLTEGDDVEVRGEYVYDPRGGLIHGGYVKVGGKVYQ